MAIETELLSLSNLANFSTEERLVRSLGIVDFTGRLIMESDMGFDVFWPTPPNHRDEAGILLATIPLDAERELDSFLNSGVWTQAVVERRLIEVPDPAEAVIEATNFVQPDTFTDAIRHLRAIFPVDQIVHPATLT